jgi:hypothetical protein
VKLCHLVYICVYMNTLQQATPAFNYILIRTYVVTLPIRRASFRVRGKVTTWQSGEKATLAETPRGCLVTRVSVLRSIPYISYISVLHTRTRCTAGIFWIINFRCSQAGLRTSFSPCKRLAAHQLSIPNCRLPPVHRSCQVTTD